MGIHTEEFLLSVLCVEIVGWITKAENCRKHLDRKKQPFIDEIYQFCKNKVNSSYNFIELEEEASRENDHETNDLNNKKKIKGLFSRSFS